MIFDAERTDIVMFKGFYNLASGMLTQGRKLDIISNNMTNVATAGFKADRYTASTFQEVMWSLVGNKEKRYTELGMESFITAPSQLYTDYTQGAFDETGLPLDFAIEGEGFFAIQTNDGRVYTRSGSFALDNEGYLCLSGQGRVLDPNGQTIRLVTDKIKSDGFGGLTTENGGYLGQIGVFTFPDNDQLEKNDQGLFTSDVEGTAVTARIHKGMVERSNVDLVQQMVEMISTQRAYQSAAELTKIYDDFMTKATTDVGRV